MEVILIRHTSVDVPPGVCYGQTDVPLKPTFEQEAAVTQENLKAFLPFDHVYTSPLTRCVRLATYCGYPDAEPASLSASPPTCVLLLSALKEKAR